MQFDYVLFDANLNTHKGTLELGPAANRFDAEQALKRMYGMDITITKLQSDDLLEDKKVMFKEIAKQYHES